MKKQEKICGVKGCRHASAARGLCTGHRYRLRRYGEAYADVPLGRAGAGMTPAKRRRLQAIPADSKHCTTCKRVKLLTAFPKNKGGVRGRCHHCKSCQRDYWLQHKYNITTKDYERLLRQQRGCCALCHTALAGSHGGHFAVDHNHKTGYVRGLLCRACNQHVVGIIEKRGIPLARLRDYLTRGQVVREESDATPSQ